MICPRRIPELHHHETHTSRFAVENAIAASKEAMRQIDDCVWCNGLVKTGRCDCDAPKSQEKKP